MKKSSILNITPGMVAAYKAALEAKEAATSLKTIRDGIVNEALQHLGFTFEVSPAYTKFVTEIDATNDYLLKEELWPALFEKVYAAWVERGLALPNPDHCPASVARAKQIDLEKAFLDAMRPITKMSALDFMNHSMKTFEEALHLHYTLFANYVRLK